MTTSEYIEARSIPEPNSGCWLWLLKVGKHGYGGAKHGGKMVRAHRLSWAAFKGPIPDGLSVLHKCDVKSCVNPGHLFLGTQAENIADKMRKGREARGERQGLAKLTAEQVLAIRADPRPSTAIAAHYGIRRHTVWNIVTRKTWRHL